MNISYILTFLSKYYRFQSFFSFGFYIFLLVAGLTIGFVIAGIISLFAGTYIITMVGKQIYYKKLKYEWKFDKLSQSIELQKRFTNWKKQRIFSFNEIKKLFYHLDHDYPDASIYKLSFVLMNYKKFKIYRGEKDDCRSLGITISRFVKKPLHNHYR